MQAEYERFLAAPIGQYIEFKYRANSELGAQQIGAITMQNVAATKQREKKAEKLLQQVPPEQAAKLKFYDNTMSPVERLLLFLPEPDYQNLKRA